MNGDFYFKRANGEEVLLGKNVTEQQAMILMNDFLEKHNYKSYYTRIWMKDNTVWYDVGSWNEFFCLELSDVKNKDGDDN